MTTPRRAERDYLTWYSDSRRWQGYRPRADDVVIATAWKCGTTWTQQIVGLLIFGSPEPRPVHDLSPWIDCRFLMPVDEMYALLETQTHRRFLKSHLPFDGLPHYDEVKYIHVARDGRDLCMSAWNHHGALSTASIERISASAADTHGPFPACPDDPRRYWRDWLTRGVLEGESDGYPDLSFFNLEATFWRERHRDNLLLVHFNDLKADLEGEMRRIAAFLSIELPESVWPALVDAATFDTMKKNGAMLMPRMQTAFEGGTDRFLFKGTNGRWRDVMNADDLALYDRVASRMSPGLARWIEGGRRGAGDPRESGD